MLKRKKLLTLVLGGSVLGATAAVALAAPGAQTGPSSSKPPYLVRAQNGVETESILTTGDSVPKVGGGNYRMVGIPDGLGAYDNNDGTFTMLSNHELPSGEGVVRRHGAKGSFVSKWTINKSDLSVVSGEDLIQTVNVWNGTTWTLASGDAAPNRLNRLCSADLAPISAFYNSATGMGYNGRLFMDGEETSGGRPFAHVIDAPNAGNSYELTPWLGTMAFENSVANPGTGDKTTVVETDDTSPGTSGGNPVGGQVYVYNGTKTDTGNEVQKAGLTGGKLYGIKVVGTGIPQNEAAKSDWAPGDEFDFDAVDVSAHAGVGGSGANTLEGDSQSGGVTNFQRPEDGSWDPTHPSDFYFVTTSNFGPNSAGTLDGHTRLWRLRFDDPADPSQGGTIKLLINGPVGTPDQATPASSTPGNGTGVESANEHGPQMLDNITVDSLGRVIMEEDVGGQAYRGGVWVYDTTTGSLSEVAIADPDVFKPSPFHKATPPAGFVTKDEEASGVIPAPFLGPDAYLLDEQVHKASSDPELVEGGQYMKLNIPLGK